MYWGGVNWDGDNWDNNNDSNDVILCIYLPMYLYLTNYFFILQIMK